VDWLVEEAKITVQAWVPGGQVAVVDVVGVDVVGVEVVGVDVVGVDVVGVVVVGVDVVGVEVVGVEVVGVVPEVTVSKPDPVPVEPVLAVGLVLVVGLVDDVAFEDPLVSLLTATARAPVPSASSTSASAMIRAPLPVAIRGALGVGAPHCRQ